MGIHDRDYYREPTQSWWANSGGVRVTVGVMVLLSLTFVAQVLGSGRGWPDLFLVHGAFDIDAVFRGEIWRAWTSFFLHRRDALLLVGLAVWALYFFGRTVEVAYGSLEYGTYLITACGVISLVKICAGRFFDFEADALTFGIGPILASVLVLYACRNSRGSVFFIVSMPSYVAVGLVIGLECLGEFGGGAATSGKVAHLTGALFAVAYYQLDKRISRLLFLETLLSQRKAPRSKSIKLFTTLPQDNNEEAMTREPDEAFVPRPALRTRPGINAQQSVDEQLEAKLDQVLEKLSHTDKAGLTPEEQSILLRASEIFKRRKAP